MSAATFLFMSMVPMLFLSTSPYTVQSVEAFLDIKVKLVEFLQLLLDMFSFPNVAFKKLYDRSLKGNIPREHIPMCKCFLYTCLRMLANFSVTRTGKIVKSRVNVGDDPKKTECWEVRFTEASNVSLQ